MTPELDEIIYSDIAVNSEDFVSEVYSIILKIKPEWKLENLSYKLFSDGITNKLIGVRHNGDIPNTILVRLYGENTEKLIDRTAEIKNMKILNSLGLGPKIYACFSNGIAYEYFPGTTLNVESCLHTEIYPLVAAKMAVFHQQLENLTKSSSAENNSTPGTFLWGKLRTFLSLLPESFHDEDKQIRFLKHCPRKGTLEQELSWMECELSKLASPIVFCHNDLLLGNILYDESKKTVNFIDFEYAAPNYRAYDIANHFCEFAGVEVYEPSRYPSEAFRRNWIAEYLKSFTQEPEINDSEVDALLDHVERFSIAAHFFWGVWSLIQAANSSIDFDFLGYAVQRLEQFNAKKEMLFSSKP